MRSIVSAGDLTMGYRLVFAILSLVAASAAGAGPLHDAARRGDIEDVERLLLLGHEINAKDENDATPLHWAANSGHSAVTKLLIARGDLVGHPCSSARLSIAPRVAAHRKRTPCHS